MAQKKVILIIMDGWGLGKVASADAIQNANTPVYKVFIFKIPQYNFDYLWRSSWPARWADGQF